MITSTRFATSFAALLSAVAVAPALGQTATSYQGTVPVWAASPTRIQLNPDVEVFPGQIVELRASGSVNVNHRNFEVRRCKNLGLSCRWENRAEPRMVDVGNLVVTYQLRMDDGTPIATAKFDPSETCKEDHPDGTPCPVRLAFPINDAPFTTSARLFAMIEKEGSPAPPIDRTPCTDSRPPFCSSGALDVSVSAVDVSQRMAALESVLKDFSTLDAASVQSDDFVDTLLIDTLPGRLKVQELFAKALHEARGSWASDTAGARKAIELSRYALSLSTENKGVVASLNNIVMEGYLAAGDFRRVALEGGALLDSAKRECTEKGHGSDSCLAYARGLRSHAIATSQRRQNFSSGDIRVAIAMIETAISVSGCAPSDVDSHAPVNPCERPDPDGAAARDLVKGLYVDGGRMLSLLRSRPDLEKAVTWLSEGRRLGRFSEEAAPIAVSGTARDGGSLVESR